MFPNCLQRLRDFELRHNPMVVSKPRVELAFAFRSLWHCQCSLVKLLIMMQATLPTGHQFHASLKFRPQPNIFQSDGNNSGAHTRLCSYSALYTTAVIRPYENPRALQGRTVFNRYLGIGRSNRKISKSKVVVFFNFASGRTLSTQSTGPQPIQLVPK